MSDLWSQQSGAYSGKIEEPMAESPDDIVGHKTFRGDGPLSFRHEPLTRREAEALMAEIDAKRKARAELMPDEGSAIKMMFDAYDRLRELGWNDAVYCPKDGTHFQVIENGSTGIFDCVYCGEWPTGHWMSFDEDDAYPSSRGPALYKLYPEDEVKRKEKLEAHRKRIAELDAQGGGHCAADN